MKKLWNMFEKKYLQPNISLNKTKQKFFVAILFAIAISVFITVLFQAPTFSDRNFNVIYYFIWPSILFLVLLFDYKSFLTSLIKDLLYISLYFIIVFR